MLKQPRIGNHVFIAPDADVYGDVVLEEECSVWFHAVIRAELADILIGRGSNIQDGTILHVDEGSPIRIGEHVTVGHGAILHGCRIGSGSLIGMGAVVMNGAVIGKDCIVGAKALVTGGMRVPDGSLVLGSPAVLKRALTPQEREANLANAAHYTVLAAEYAGWLSQGKGYRSDSTWKI